jgi:predicted nucleic acid-binding protein
VTRRAIDGLTLDTGALLALDRPRSAATMQAMLAEATRREAGICVPIGTVAQAWRSPRQVRLARLLKSPDVEIPLITATVARAVGVMCGEVGHDDVIDVHVVMCARERGHAVVTSDPADIARVDAALRLIAV